jgi:hypothetical protein
LHCANEDGNIRSSVPGWFPQAGENR